MIAITVTALLAALPGLKNARENTTTRCSDAAVIVVVSAFVLLGAPPAHAQSARTFVSGTGSDASATCGRAAPCRTFAGAIGKTEARGEIVVLDPAGYGTVVIDKSISIINDGVGEAGIRPSGGGIGITINAGPLDVVNLRGLTIDGGSGTATGIRLNTGKSLNVQNCVIRNISGDGIAFLPNASSNLGVSNTIISGASRAIAISPSGAGTVTAIFNRIELYDNQGHGLAVSGTTSKGTIKAAVVDSVAANNSANGFIIQSSASTAAISLMLVRTVSANNGDGVVALGANTTVRSTQSTITGNGLGWAAAGGGVLQSYGDNNIDGNTDDGGFPPTIPTR